MSGRHVVELQPPPHARAAAHAPFSCPAACIGNLKCGKYVYFSWPASTYIGGVAINCLLWSGEARAMADAPACLRPDMRAGVAPQDC